MNASTAPLDPRVRDAMLPLIEAPQPVTGGEAVTRTIADAARVSIASWCGAGDPEEIVFTSGGTESCNMAIKGPAFWNLSRGGGKRRILALATEHTAVLYPLRTLGRLGFDAQEIPVDGDGVVDLDALDELLKTPTLLVSMAPANAETGTLQPIERVAALARERGALVHLDACLAAAYAAIDVRALGADLASLSAHKIGGPRGAGALWARAGVPMLPLVEGGVDEGGRRGGAQNIMAIAGFGAAARIRKEEEPQARQRLARQSARLESALLGVEGVRVNGPGGPGGPGGAARRVPGMVNVSVPGIDGEALITKLALRGFAVSSGSSCFQETGKPSHVLLAMGIDPTRARGSVLFSLGPDTRDEDIGGVIEIFPEVVASLRAIGPASDPFSDARREG